MKSLAELKELRNKVQKEMKKRDQGTRAEIIVGMGTCGIAAGARDILKAVFPHQNILVNLVHIAVLSAIIGTLHAMIWSASVLLQTTATKITQQLSFSPTIYNVFVGSAIATTYATISDLDTYFSLTVISIVSAYTLSLLTLLTLVKEWKNGKNIITLAGLIATSMMCYFALQTLSEKI